MAPFAQSASFIAGLLIGLALVTGTFAMVGEEVGTGSTYLAVVALLILVCGIALQIRLTPDVISKMRR